MHKTYLSKTLNSLFFADQIIKKEIPKASPTTFISRQNYDTSIYFAASFNFLNISSANSVPPRLIEILTSPSTVFSIKVPAVNVVL